MLNLPEAVAATYYSVFGEVGDQDFGMAEIRCFGDEEDIRDCPHSTDIPEWCDGGSAAGVVCGGNTSV